MTKGKNTFLAVRKNMEANLQKNNGSDASEEDFQSQETVSEEKVVTEELLFRKSQQ